MPLPQLQIMPQRLAVARLDPAADLPAWLPRVGFLSITRTSDELSIVVDEQALPGRVTAETGWRMVKVLGPLDFSLVGVLASLANPLAAAGVSIFAISTYDTDYLLVREAQFPQALAALAEAGFDLLPA
ncbi:MAG: ACT domain-containing protein [Chloroflexi bacterium]|nr:ACT domain-containing protein [Chloroflexota bacterium]